MITRQGRCPKRPFFMSSGDCSKLAEGNGFDAVELVQQVPNGNMDYERWICSPGRLYVVTSEWNASEQQPPEIERIVASFRLLTAK